MAIQVGDVIRSDVVMEFDGTEDVVNSYQFSVDVINQAGDAGILDDIREFLEGLYDLWEAIQSVKTLFTTIKNRNITQQLVYSDTAMVGYTGGTVVGDAVPPGNAIVCSFKTGVPRVEMRKYIGVPAETNLQDDGRVNAAGMTVIGNAAAYLLAGFSGSHADLSYGYFSPKTDSFVMPTVASYNNVTGYQRRRKQGTGS